MESKNEIIVKKVLNILEREDEYSVDEKETALSSAVITLLSNKQKLDIFSLTKLSYINLLKLNAEKKPHILNNKIGIDDNYALIFNKAFNLLSDEDKQLIIDKCLNNKEGNENKYLLAVFKLCGDLYDDDVYVASKTYSKLLEKTYTK